MINPYVLSGNEHWASKQMKNGISGKVRKQHRLRQDSIADDTLNNVYANERERKSRLECKLQLQAFYISDLPTQNNTISSIYFKRHVSYKFLSITVACKSVFNCRLAEIEEIIPLSRSTISITLIIKYTGEFIGNN